MEKVLTVEGKLLLKFIGETQGVIPDAAGIIETIYANYQYMDRAEAEINMDYRQIIPYVVLARNGSIFLLKRLRGQTESRLHDLLSIGIGGHINPSDKNADVIMDGLYRELHEEINIERHSEPQFIGVICDDTSEVSRVHLGLLYLVKSEQEDITVRETEKMNGQWVTLERALSLKGEMEMWSQMALEHIAGRL